MRCSVTKLGDRGEILPQGVDSGRNAGIGINAEVILPIDLEIHHVRENVVEVRVWKTK